MFRDLLAHVFLTSTLVSAALFPKDTKVKFINEKQFEKTMKHNRTVGIAFVAPWCGHCQSMAPEWSRAAESLHPLIPLFAVDCDAQHNKALCAKEGVQGFPTIKLYPRGGKIPSIVYNEARTAKAMVPWITQKAPSRVRPLSRASDIPSFASSSTEKPRALLLTKDHKVPLLWQILSVIYADRIVFASHRDKEGNAARSILGPQVGNESKVILYPAGLEEPHLYQGTNKLDPLTKFLDAVLDGTAQLPVLRKHGVSGTQTPETNTPASTKKASASTEATSDSIPPTKAEQTPVSQESEQPKESKQPARDEL